MATSSTSHYADSSTLANFKAWAQFISNAFSSFGWTQAGDTGQVNWSTIATVPTSGTYVYEVWTSADSLIACTITVKFEYGENAGAGPAAYVTVGTNGTDGAGNLLSPKSDRTALPFYSVNDATDLLTCSASGDTGSMRAAMFTSTMGYPAGYLESGFLILRSVDTAGALNADYVSLLTWGGVGTFTQQTVMAPGVGGVTTQEVSGWMALATATATSESFDGNVAVSPVFPMVGYFGNPGVDVYVGKAADFSDGNVLSISPYGVAHNYLVVNNPNAASRAFVRSNTNSLLMRYE